MQDDVDLKMEDKPGHEARRAPYIESLYIELLYLMSGNVAPKNVGVERER